MANASNHALSLSLLFPLSCSQRSVLRAHTVTAALLLAVSVTIPSLFSAQFEPISHYMSPITPSLFSPSVPRQPATVANLITHRFMGECGEVNRGDKEGKDRSNEEGRRWGRSGESNSQMLRDKQEHVGLRWKLSTNFKECIGKSGGSCRVRAGGVGWGGGGGGG